MILFFPKIVYFTKCYFLNLNIYKSVLYILYIFRISDIIFKYYSTSYFNTFTQESFTM